jgi:leader peptidase (prepilin peptidase) / N-methyltransferase
MSALVIAGSAIAGFARAGPQRALIALFSRQDARQPHASPPCPHRPVKLYSLMLRAPIARCPECGRKLAPPLLLTGAVTALLLAAVSYRVHPWPVAAAAGWLVICGVPLAFIDARVHRLPDVLTAAAFTGVMAFLTVAADMTNAWQSLGRAALGGAILACCYFAAALLKPGHIGLGDGKAAASAGSLMAWFGWGTLMDGTFASLVLAAVYGLALLTTHRATLKTHIAYGPVLLAGSVLAVMLTAHARAY